MSRKITAEIAFKIESSFYEWANKFDSKAANIRNSEFDIKILFKGFIKDDSQKLICIQKALWENIQNILQSNSEQIKSHIRFLNNGRIFMNMNRFRIILIIILFLSLSYLSVTFLEKYNSPENIEKRCILKFEKDFKNHLDKSYEEWNQILDLADYNYLKCMGIP